MRLDGQVAVVTGGGAGIGAAICARVAELGADVVVADISTESANAVESRIAASSSGRICAMHVDVRDEGSVSRLAQLVVEQFGGIHVWINNAGTYPRVPALELTVDTWDLVQDINLRGTFLGAREAARRMRSAGTPGVIVNIASTAGYRVRQSGFAGYVAAKHGVRGLTKALAVEFGPYGIRVVAVAPGLIDTPGIRGESSHEQHAHRLADYARVNPLGRYGTADEVACVVAFCATNAARFISGCTVMVDGADLAGSTTAPGAP